MSNNIRVHELSRELGVQNKDVMDAAQHLGISLRSHTSAMSDEEVKRIKDKLRKSPNHKHLAASEAKENREEIKVFRSESGEEVTERRKGGSVVIRRKKKVEESEPEALAPQEIDEPAAQLLEPQALTQITESAPETAAKEVPSAQTSQNDQPAPVAEESRAKPAEPKTPDKTPAPVKDEVKQKAIDAAEEAKKAKKKGYKVKPAREEIIDEDTLEELRRAFRTKLPARKKEYLVDDKRKKPADSAAPYRKPSDEPYRDSSYRGSSVSAEPERQNGQVIPFPAKPQRKSIKIGEAVSVGELAHKMGVKAAEVIKKLMSLGVMATINQSIDTETAMIIAQEWDFDVTADVFEESELLHEVSSADAGEFLLPRYPVVTVMGHVDHGKTSLLDSIRHTNVVEREAGGITQHIGAYSVPINDRKVVFIDTPGHEAFTAMRARGAKVTDVVVLVVAADDGVMPQTIEALNHAKAAGVPVIVAVNKIDKPEANPERVKRQLSEIGLISEEWGGDTLFAEVSAKKKTGIKELLELILLQADILELKANPVKRANGVIIEAQLDKGRGPVATVVVSEGTLGIGDYLVAGTTYGKVRALIDDKGARMRSAGPSEPAQIMGLSGVPGAGDHFYVVKDEKTAKEVVSHREAKERQKFAANERKISLEGFFDSLKKGEVKELRLIIKADVQGSLEALREAISKLISDKCRTKIVHAGVGAVNETDIVLAAASNAVVVGFNVRPDANALEFAEKENVSLELHTIIYEVVDRIKKAMEGLLEPVIKEKVLGHAEVRATFRISKAGVIAGCFVKDGKIQRSNSIRVVRDGVTTFEGKLDSLKRFKDDAREVQSGYECGVAIQNFDDLKVGDVLEFYTFEEIRQEL
ncbi:MAG: translation initiation factor IF-2 [Deltaproteobacteria bacterium]